MTALLGWTILAVLTAFAGVDALGIALRTAPSGRAELAVAAMASFFALLSAPVLALGYADRLTPENLAVASLVLFAAVFSWITRGRPPAASLRACVRAGSAIARTPLDGLREAARARSVAFLGLLWAGGLIALAFALTCILPFTCWDGVLYHDSM